jgi:hypothetical protein
VVNVYSLRIASAPAYNRLCWKFMNIKCAIKQWCAKTRLEEDKKFFDLKENFESLEIKFESIDLSDAERICRLDRKKRLRNWKV